MRSNNDYELFEELGRGRHTVVYRARNLLLHQEAAVKELTDEARKDPECSRQLLESVQFLANLPSNDHVVRVYNFVRENDWLVLELMKESLADTMKKAGTGLAPDLVRDVLRQALEGLQVLHQAGRWHGNLKPENLLISDAGRVKIADSPGLMSEGIARPPQGVPKYVAPERIDNSFGEVGPGTDLYSLGFTALELLKGPGFDGLFKGTGADAVDAAVGWLRLHGSASESIPAATDVVKGLPADLARVIDKLLCKKVAGRYATAADALADLNKVQAKPAAGKEKAAAPPPTPKPPESKQAPAPSPTARPPQAQTAPAAAKAPPRKNKAVFFGLIGLFVAAAGLLAFLVFSPGSPAIVTVRITSTPDGATVTILDPDNPNKPASAKKTNNDYNVALGKQKIRLERDGYVTREEWIDPAEKKEFAFALKPIQRQLKPKEEKSKKEAPKTLVNLLSNPPGAQVWKAVKGQASSTPLGPTPLKVPLEPGDYRLTFSLTDFKAEEIVLSVGKEEITKTIDLVRVAPRSQPTTAVTRPPAKYTYVDLGDGVTLKMVLIPSGRFAMGSPETEMGRRDDERQHEVEITRPFYMGVYEVTQEEFAAVMGRNPSRFSPKGAGKDAVTDLDTSRFPVEQIRWEDAVEFCKRLSDKTGKTFDLPTEAEWEYSCRAGTTSVFPMGDSLSSKQANFNGIPYGTAEKGPYLKHTSQVGQHAANPWGLFDMQGNVWELCKDWYDKDYYNSSPRRDPQGPAEGTLHVGRGGSWVDPAELCRSAGRWNFGFAGNEVYINVGFRVVTRLAADNSGPQWVELFNGKDLTGWKVHPDDGGADEWRVEGGAIVGSGPTKNYLFSERGDFDNFHIRAEVMINARGNSGLYFRAPFISGLRSDKAYEAQICLFDEVQMTGSLHNIVKVSEPLHKPDEWFTLDVVARGDHIRIKVNDKVAVDTHDDRWTRGHIALQLWDPQTVVKFRKIAIKELPPPLVAVKPKKKDDPPPQPAKVTIKSDPGGAEVWISGGQKGLSVKKGLAPLELELYPGQYVIDFKHQGYDERELDVTINPGDTMRTLAVQLAKSTVPVPGEEEYKTALRLYYGKGRMIDENQALDLFKQAADKGNVVAQSFVGLMLCKGEGVPAPNRATGEELLRKSLPELKTAAEKGSGMAQTNLGTMYREGYSVAQNGEEAVRWFRMAADKGLAVAQDNMGDMYAMGQGVPRDYVEAFRWYKMAADKGLAWGQNDLAVLYRDGTGTDKNEGEAVRLFGLAAEQGYSEAQNNLGWCYLNGIGIDRNDDIAVTWFRKAADRGHSTAQNNMGWCYQNGFGLEKSDAQAVDWYRRSALQGNAWGQNNLAWAYQNNQGNIGLDYVEALSWYQKSADQGFAMAQNSLGSMLEHGMGTGRDVDKAIFWYRKAADQGDNDAKVNLERLLAESSSKKAPAVIPAPGPSPPAKSSSFLPEAKQLQTLKWHTAPVTCVAISDDGAWVVTGSTDGNVIVWDAQGKMLWRNNAIQADGTATGGVHKVVMAGDRKYVACSSFSSGTWRLYDGFTGKFLQSFEGHSEGIISLAMSGDGNYVATGSMDKTAILWDVSRSLKVRVHTGFKSSVNALALSGDGKFLAAASRLDGPYLWDTSSGKEERTFANDRTMGVAMGFTGARLLTWSQAKLALLWDVKSGSKVQAFNVVNAMAMSREGEFVVGSQDLAVTVWESSSAQSLALPRVHSRSIDAVAISAGGRFVVTASDDNTAILWQVR